VSMNALPDLKQLETLWRDLEGRANGSFFTSWAWIGAWLTTYAIEAISQAQLRLLIGEWDGRIVALGIVCRSRQPRLLWGSGAVVQLHQTARADDGAAYIEYNSFLIEEGFAQAASVALLDLVASPHFNEDKNWSWVEFRISGADPIIMSAIRESRQPYRISIESKCPWVDLKKILPDLEGYISFLSSNTRAQIRRSIRLIERGGPVAITSASSPSEAKSYLEELQFHHQAAWQRRDEGLGAFSSPRFLEFVNKLIEIGHAAGSVDLLRISAGQTTIGLLLNFVHAGEVYAYQSGFVYSEDNRLKPGLVSHALGVAYYRNRHMSGYHFMAGEARYKSSLGLATETLTWLALRRADSFSRLEDAARSLKKIITRI